MAYSFTEQKHDEDNDEEDVQVSAPPPMMVPVADIFNHVSNNNARLNFGTDSLQMLATTDIKQGEEVFNTYGELSNYHLLHMYGFSEKKNAHDTVDISNSIVESVLRDLHSQFSELFEKKW